LLRDIQEMVPGDRLPTEGQLMDRFGVSRTTVRDAIHELVRIGLLRRRSGSGTFVADPPIEQDLSRLTGFVEDMRALRLEPKATLVTAEDVLADEHVADQLRVPAGTSVVLLERIRLANNLPISFDISYLPRSIGSRLAQENLVDEPIFDILENKYAIKLGFAEYRVSALNANERIAQFLGLPSMAAVLQVERTVYSPAGDPLVFEYLYYRGDRVRYRLTLRR
jgi:GntR family transcriptional regulator